MGSRSSLRLGAPKAFLPNLISSGLVPLGSWPFFVYHAFLIWDPRAGGYFETCGRRGVLSPEALGPFIVFGIVFGNSANA